jgi:putative Mg2+ transporter-C (MgtC) family protein
MPVAPTSEAQLLLRVTLAVLIAAVLGWERERAGKPAGLRTHALVGLAAALYTTLGTLSIAQYHQADPDFRPDPIRIIQAVALGIGFLGGGVISVGARNEGHATGLTTAASVWSTAAIGIATGLGYYILAVGATVLQLVVLHLLERLERPRSEPRSRGT